MADVDPDLEAAAEALWRWEHSQRAWSEVAPFAADAYRSAAAAVLAALRAAGWQKAETIAAHIEEMLDDEQFDEDRTLDQSVIAVHEFGASLLAWLTPDPAAVGEMGAAQAEPAEGHILAVTITRGFDKRLRCECGAEFGTVGELSDHQAKPEPECLCWLIRPQTWQEPAEWEQNPNCPQHPMQPVVAPMSHAVLGDETSTSGGVGIPSAAVPEQPSEQVGWWHPKSKRFVPEFSSYEIEAGLVDGYEPVFVRGVSDSDLGDAVASTSGLGPSSMSEEAGHDPIGDSVLRADTGDYHSSGEAER